MGLKHCLNTAEAVDNVIIRQIVLLNIVRIRLNTAEAVDNVIATKKNLKYVRSLNTAEAVDNVINYEDITSCNSQKVSIPPKQSTM